ncbi:MAG: hypothetical protein ACYTEI_07680, partial [Planctomycetota bacterium]
QDADKEYERESDDQGYLVFSRHVAEPGVVHGAGDVLCRQNGARALTEFSAPQTRTLVRN